MGGRLASRAGLIVIFASVVLVAGVGYAQARNGPFGPGLPVSGRVFGPQGPAGGLRVQLFSATVGPSQPVFTNGEGAYFFAYVPTQVNAPYQLRVYWGPRLLYSAWVQHLGPQPPIHVQ